MNSRVVEENAILEEIVVVFVVVDTLVEAGRHDCVDLSGCLLAKLQEDQRRLLSYRIHEQNRKHDNEHGAESQAEVTFVPCDVL